MRYSDKCDHCDHEVTAYEHSLNAKLVDALVQLVDFELTQHRRVNLQIDLSLSVSQYNNFQKLQYFGLIEKTDLGWKPTFLGIGFVKGKVTVYDRVATFGRQILSNDHIAWGTSEHKPKKVCITDIKNYVWKPKEAWQLERARADSLF